MKVWVVIALVVAAAAFVFIGSNRLNDGERAVLTKLNDPDSAKFGKSFKSKRADSVWCGEVNAKNRMGGYVGMTRYVVDVWSEGPNDYSKVVFEDATGAVDQVDLFGGRWSAFCE
jgi:hypothetical protein